MLDFINYEDFKAGAALDQAYYVPSRWEYMNCVAGLVREHLPGAASVLELGPHKFPIVKGCDTAGLNREHYAGMTHCFDAGKKFPWPVDKKYDLFIGLQVFEHLAEKRSAFKEVERIASSAVISIPYKWRCNPDNCHHMLDENSMLEWSGGRKPDVSIIITNRLISLYKF